MRLDSDGSSLRRHLCHTLLMVPQGKTHVLRLAGLRPMYCKTSLLPVGILSPSMPTSSILHLQVGSVIIALNGNVTSLNTISVILSILIYLPGCPARSARAVGRPNQRVSETLPRARLPGIRLSSYCSLIGYHYLLRS